MQDPRLPRLLERQCRPLRHLAVRYREVDRVPLSLVCSSFTDWEQNGIKGSGSGDGVEEKACLRRDNDSGPCSTERNI